MLIHANSLSETIDAVNDALSSGQKISASDRKDVANWIAKRQGLPGAYANTFAGFESERKKGILLYTGERVTSASARHILGEEACRAMCLLDVPGTKPALKRATSGLQEAIAVFATTRHNNPGRFCCGKCTVGLWRHLVVGGLDQQEERLRQGIKYLHSMRDGNGGWRTFPFWYTLLVLSESETPGVDAEIRYVLTKLQRAAKGSPSTKMARRRQQIAQRALARI